MWIYSWVSTSRFQWLVLISRKTQEKVDFSTFQLQGCQNWETTTQLNMKVIACAEALQWTGKSRLEFSFWINLRWLMRFWNWTKTSTTRYFFRKRRDFCQKINRRCYLSGARITGMKNVSDAGYRSTEPPLDQGNVDFNLFQQLRFFWWKHEIFTSRDFSQFRNARAVPTGYT